jgi:carbamoyl-phosphate synthase large subunit
VVDWIARGDVDLVVNTPTGSGARSDGYEIRSVATAQGIPCITTLTGALAAVRAIRAARDGEPEVLSLQELHRPEVPTA